MTTSENQPARIVIVGGSGKVAREIIVQLHARGDEPVAVFRSASRVDEITELGAVPVVLDIESASVDDLAAVVAGADAVVFSAGAGGGDAARTNAVDYEGALLAIAATTQAGVARFVIVSAIGAGNPVPDDLDEAWRPYYTAKHDADVAVTESGLDYTILRPGTLTDDAATGSVSLGDTVEHGDVSRADVAAVVIAAIDDRSSVGHAWEFTNGDVPIADAVAASIG
jgi:uncharacterized protein YbjT (DUF2867 family)